MESKAAQLGDDSLKSQHLVCILTQQTFMIGPVLGAGSTEIYMGHS